MNGQRWRHRDRRRGFSLLEIMLAMAILGSSLAILSVMVTRAVSAAREARELAVARMLCQTKVAEILLDGTAGISPQSVAQTPLDAFDSGSTTPFVFSVEVEQGQLEGLLSVRVIVEGLDPDGGPPLARYAINRWMIDPLLGLEEAEMEEEAAKEAASGDAEI